MLNQSIIPPHTKIKELKDELRRQQLKYFDSGMIPEEMRADITEMNITVYDFVRNPELYPLAKYTTPIWQQKKNKNFNTGTLR